MPTSRGQARQEQQAQRPAFGALLKRLRLGAGLTQEDLANRVGYSVAYVSMLERGQRLPLPITAQLLTDALALPPANRALLLAAARPQQGLSLFPAPGQPDQTPIVGRTRELTALEHHLVAGGDGPPVLVFAGEPGIGKSRLLREADRLGERCDWRVLRGGCQRRGGQEPYAPLLAALDGYLRHQQPARLRDDLHACRWLVRLLPELADMGLGLDPLPPDTLPPEQERRLMADALTRFLAHIAGPAGALLALDDLQWADPDALHLLTMLVEAAPAHGFALRVVAAYRDSEVQPRDTLSDMLADLARTGLVTHLALAPLAPAEAARLLDEVAEEMPAPLRERLLQRTGGVPFFLLSCAQAVRADVLTGQDEAVPWDVAQGVRQRIARLPGVARNLLDIASVVGREAPRALLLALAGQPEEETLAALEAACHARLLREDDAAYTFAHDVIREVIEAGLGAGQRSVLHRRVAEALERDGAPAEALAYHYARGGAHDKAALYAQRAGDRAQKQFAHSAAERYYREAIDRWTASGHALDAARAGEKLGALLARTARYDEAFTVLEEVAAAYGRAGDTEGLRRVVARIGDAHAGRGTPEQGIQRLRPLLQQADDDDEAPAPGLIALYIALGDIFFVGGRYDEHLAVTERADALARALGDKSLLLQTMLSRGRSLFLTERNADALSVLGEAAALAESLDDPDSLSRALGNMATIYLNEGTFDASRACNDRAIAANERAGNPVIMVRLVCSRGLTALFTGDWRQARADFTWALDESRRIGLSSGNAYPEFYLGFLCLVEGAWNEARRHLDTSMGIAEPMGDLQVLRWSCAAQAWCDVLEEQPARARDRLSLLLERGGTVGPGVAWLLLFLAWAQLEQGNAEAATATVAQAVARARSERDHFALVEALRVQALAAVARACWDTAEPALEEGLALARRLPYPYGEGRLLSVYAALRRDTGDPHGAATLFAAALDIFQRLGARKDLEWTRTALKGEYTGDSDA